MSTYTIKLDEHPTWHNRPVKESFVLDAHTLTGLVMMVFALIGEEMGSYFQILDRSDRLVFSPALLETEKTILLSGSEAFSAPSTSQELFSQYNIKPTQRFTLHIGLPANYYVVQFDDLHFLKGLLTILGWFYLEPFNHLFSLYEGNEPLQFKMK